MKKNKKNYQRLNLYLDQDFFEIFQLNATKDYLKSATRIKCFLKKQLQDKNNIIQNTNNQNGNL